MSSEKPKRQHAPAPSELVHEVLGLIRATADQTSRIDQLAATQFGLNDTDARALEIVSRTGPVTATRLAQDLGMTTGGVTTVIDRLERAGYARRRRDGTDDRRRVMVEATNQTRQAEKEMFGKLIRDTAELVASYNERELAIIRDFLQRSQAQLAAHIERRSRPQQ